MTKIVGLTGGIATGKTTVSNILRQAGIPVIDADQVARQVQTPDSVGLTRIVKVFGPKVLLPTGELVCRVPEQKSLRSALSRFQHAEQDKLR